MTEQTTCYAQLHDQRKAAVSLFHLHMQSLARIVLVNEPVEMFELFAKDIQHSTSDINDRMRYHISELAEQFPHLGDTTYGELSVACKFCNKALGWKCPNNPKGYCEYDYEREDSYGLRCVHCGHPEERK